MKTFVQSSCIFLLIVTVLSGCANPVAGTWRNVKQNGRPVPPSRQLTTTFGSFGAATIADPRTSTRSEGSYTVRKDLITLKADGHAQTYHFKVAGDELRFERVGSSVVFRRAASQR